MSIHPTSQAAASSNSPLESQHKNAPRQSMVSRGLKPRLLIIRFSSFGDIVQASSVPDAFCRIFSSEPGAESRVDWLTRSDFKDLLSRQPAVSRVISFERGAGLLGLLKLAWQLASQDIYTHVYDAHNNLRSHLFTWVFFSRSLGTAVVRRKRWPRFARRSKDRLRRWLFFRFRLPVLPRPFRGAESFHRPLSQWGIKTGIEPGPKFWSQAPLSPSVLRDINSLPRPLIVAAPSAAWAMKRWPVEHWKSLITLLPNAGFILMGGPEDQFLSEISAVAPERVLNFAGQLNLAQSISVLPFADLVIANDTGLLHAADQMECPTLALIGPTAFGYPSHTTSETLEIELSCKPCSKDGRGKCINQIYQRCLVELTPEFVASKAKEVLSRVPKT